MKNTGKLIKFVLLTSTCVAISGCVIEPSDRAKRVQVAMSEMVTDCSFVGEVCGTSKLSLVPQGEQLSRYRALDQAARLGATHVVWDNSQNKITNYAVSGRAYYCDPDRVMPRSYKYIDQYLRANRYPYDESK